MRLGAPASRGGRSATDAAWALADAKLQRLRELDPLLIDISLREPCSSSRLGHTLQNKLDTLALLDEFGLKEKVLATFNYQLSDQPQVEDDFCRHLALSGYAMTGCFALTSVGTLSDDGGSFVPDPSMRKLVEYGVPNTIHELYLMPPPASRAQALASITASVQWLLENVRGDLGGPCRVYFNVIDLVDALVAERDWACAVLEHLARLDVEAVSFEDGRGTYFPFQIGAATATMKALLRPEQKVLFHCHAGNGMENASAIEALLEGADGYWAGLEKQAATSGHASLGELIANLLRAGNRQIAQRYPVQRLVPICEQLHRINADQEPPATTPMLGADAYRQMLSGFEQLPGRAMDLPPESIGGRYTYRIAPVGSDAPIIQGRVWEALAVRIDAETATRMILLMRSDLREGRREHYDHPEQLERLLQRAQA